MLSRSTVLVCFALLLAAAPARAQIYAGRDANGTWVLSDKPIDVPTDVYVVPGAPSIRTTRPVEAAGEASAFDDLVVTHANKQGLRPELVRAVIQVESGFNPRARSPKGAMGLMQLMPSTARTLGVTRPYDPDDNIRGGTRYLRLLLDRYQGDERLALAAYNAGSGAVDKFGGTIPPYRETREYVRKVGVAADGTPSGGTTQPAGKVVVYKTLEIVEGRVIPRYSSEQPKGEGTWEIVKGNKGW